MNDPLPELSDQQRRVLHEPWPSASAPTQIRHTVEGCEITSEVWPRVHLCAVRLDRVHARETRWAAIRAAQTRWTSSQIVASTWSEGTFTDVVFEDMQFHDTALASCTFERCRFERCRFASSRLLECEFRECSFTDSEFLSAEFVGTALRQCTMARCRFVNVTMTGTLDNTVIGPGSAKALQLTNIEGTTVTLKGLEIERLTVLGAALQTLAVRECSGSALTLCDLSVEHLVIGGGQPLVGLGVIGGRLARLEVDRATLVLASISHCHIQVLCCRRAEIHDCAIEQSSVAEGCTIEASVCNGLVIADCDVHGLALPETTMKGYLDIRDSRFSALDLRLVPSAPDLELVLENIAYDRSTLGDGATPDDRWEQLHGA